MAEVIGWRRGVAAKNLDECNTSITIKVKGGSRLCIEKDTGRLFKLFYSEADDTGHHHLSHIDTVNLDTLNGSLSVLTGCLGSASIKTKIGDLRVHDYKHAARLRRWLKSFEGHK